MSPYQALHGLRIGSVKYLNARPLLHTCPEPVVLQHPSELAASLAEGALDAALVPIFELFRHPGYVLVDDVAIASDGAVYSVFLAYRGELKGLERVSLDPASLTSVHLLQVLLAEFHGVRPQFVAAADANGREDGWLLIGNQAIEYRETLPSDVKILDLGAEWTRCTGLPFVYAAWLLQPTLANLPAIGAAFRRLKRDGLARLDEIIRGAVDFDPALARRYLTTHIRFGLQSREKEALSRFHGYLTKYGFVGGEAEILRFV